MSAIRFQTTAKGNLPHLSNIFRKPEPLVTEFKTVACSVIGALLFIDAQRGKEGMKDSHNHQELGATATCKKCMMEATKGIGHKSKKGEQRIVSCLIVGSPSRRWQNLQWNWEQS